MRKGIGAVGAIVLIILFAGIIYVSWSFGIVWFNNNWLKSRVRESIKTNFMLSNQAIVDDIVRYAKEKNIYILPEEVNVERPSRDSMRVKLHYTNEVKLQIYNHTFHLTIDLTEATGG